MQAEEEEEEPAAGPEERYNNGEGAPTDAKAAIAWYKEFAEAGIADAQYKLAECYFNTRSEPLNFVEGSGAIPSRCGARKCRRLPQAFRVLQAWSRRGDGRGGSC